MALLSSFLADLETSFPRHLYERLAGFPLLNGITEASLKRVLAECNWFGLPGGMRLKRDGDNGYYITPLVEILNRVARKEKKVAEMTGQKFDGELTIVADRFTPYRLLTEILYSCGQAEYANYRLLILKSRE